LIVDDNKTFLINLAQGLRAFAWRFQALTAENGEKALAVLESEHVDLVVTDLHMPVMDGFEFLSRIQKSYPDIPVIVMSACLDPDVETKLRSLGVTRCIEKTDIEKMVPMILSNLD
jgi:two-component system capsular synthesis sensor histidine kinase RcsC